MRIRPFQGIFPNFDYITSPDSFFETIKYEYPEYYESGFFYKGHSEAMFVYQIISGSRVYSGIVGCADVLDYDNAKIKKHELTIAYKEQKQLQLLLRRKAVVKPLLLGYPDVKEINDWMENYVIEKHPIFVIHFEQEDQVHKIWEIRDGNEINEIQELFKNKVPKAYIADGHHRASATSLLYHRKMQHGDNGRDYSLLFSAFFPASKLEILDYNRIVVALEDVSTTTFMAKISNYFDIEVLDSPQKPKEKHEVTMFINKEWFRLRWKKNVLNKYKKEAVILDSGLLNELVLQEIIGITDVRTDLRLEYVEGPLGVEGVQKATLREPSRVGFCLYPVQFDELMTLCDAGSVLPPKSTWFEPRLKNGVIVQAF